MNTFGPSGAGGRIELADAIRGVALLGIILANIPTAASLHSTNYWLWDSRPLNSFLEAAKHILISTKFITLFSILFGFGFYIQLQRAAEKRIHFRRYFFTRMLLLLVIGCLHAYLLWFGDIIRYYAICGMFLLLFHHVSTKKLLVWSLVFIVPLTAIVFILNGALGLQQYAYDYRIASKIFTVPSYGQYLVYNATIDPMVNFIQDSPITFVSCFGKILFGYWLGRIHFFSKLAQLRPMIQKWFWWGAIPGVGGSIGYWAVSTGRFELNIPLLWVPFLVAAGLFLHSLFYLSAFVKIFQTGRGKKLMMLFVPIGRMALTNYLLQTILYLLFFFNWTHAFNVSGKLSIAEVYVLAILFYISQVLFSYIWMRHFSHGPVEYVWKKLSYRNMGTRHSSPVPEPLC